MIDARQSRARGSAVALGLLLAALVLLVGCSPEPFGLERLLESPAPVPGGDFGAAIALGDGRVAIGAPGEGPQGAGRVHVFLLESGALERTLEPPAPQAGGGFGTALTIAGGRLFVGAPALSGQAVPGVVTAFDLTTFEPAGTWRSPDPLPEDYFGVSLVVVDDRLAVGAPGMTVHGRQKAGGVWLFGLAGAGGGDAVPQRLLASPAPGAYGMFGFALAAGGARLAVGEPRGGAAGSGSVHVFGLDDGALEQSIADPTPTGIDMFGEALVYVDGWLLVGDPRDDSDGRVAGLAHLIEPGCADCGAQLADPEASGGDRFGIALAADERLLAIGAPAKVGAAGEWDPVGQVTLFPLQQVAPDASAKAPARWRVDHPEPHASAGFGVRVAIGEERLLVSEAAAPDGPPGTGRVFVFRGLGALAADAG